MKYRAPHNAVGCIVLAAGKSLRFGSDKRYHRLASGHTLLEQTLLCLQAVFHERVLVLRNDDHELANHYISDWQIVMASEAELGMGHSLAAAMTVTSHWPGAVIALGDMPWVQATTYQSLQLALAPATLVVPHYQGQRGNPVAIGRDHFVTLSKATGDVGARHLFAQHPDLVTRLEVNDPGILLDLDTLPE
jgi:molybdenum cofactor cytidylyltransferase